MILRSYDGLISQLNQAATASADLRDQLVSQSVRLVTELRNALNVKDGGDIAVSLGEFYDKLLFDITLAIRNNDGELFVALADQVAVLRNAWK